jgi:sulfonate transport system substrate-binding protein
MANQGFSPKRIIVAVALLIVLFVGAVIAWKLYKRTKPPRQDNVVHLAAVPAAFYLPLMVAHDQALFEKYGLKSDLKLYNNNNDMMNAVLHGDADLGGLGSGGAFPLEIASPGRVRFVYGQNNQSYSFVVPSGSLISKLEDLRGKKIGTWPSPTPQALLHLMLDQRIGRDGFEIVPYEFRLLNQALKTKEVDALFSTDVFTQQAIDLDGNRLLSKIPVEEYVLKPFFNGGGLVQRDLEIRRPEVYRAIINAMKDAVSFIRTHPEEARHSLVIHIGVSEDVARRAPIDEFTQLDEIDVSNAQKVADLFFEQKVLTKKIDVASMFR